MSKIEFLKFFTLIVCAFCICESIILSYIGILNINIDNCDGKYIKKITHKIFNIFNC